MRKFVLIALMLLRPRGLLGRELVELERRCRADVGQPVPIGVGDPEDLLDLQQEVDLPHVMHVHAARVVGVFQLAQCGLDRLDRRDARRVCEPIERAAERMPSLGIVATISRERLCSLGEGRILAVFLDNEIQDMGQGGVAVRFSRSKQVVAVQDVGTAQKNTASDLTRIKRLPGCRVKILERDAAQVIADQKAPTLAPSSQVRLSQYLVQRSGV